MDKDINRIWENLFKHKENPTAEEIAKTAALCAVIEEIKGVTNRKKMEESEFCKLKYIDGRQFVTMPNGDVIPHQIKTRVTDDVKGPAVVLIKLYVSLEGVTIEEKQQ